MMYWQISAQEFLIAGRTYPIHLSLSVNRVRLPDNTSIDSAEEYFRVSKHGQVLEHYKAPFTSTLEDCLYVIDIHAVLRASLYEFFWTECYGRPGELEAKILLQNLQAAKEESLPFHPSEVVAGFHRQQSN